MKKKKPNDPWGAFNEFMKQWKETWGTSVKDIKKDLNFDAMPFYTCTATTTTPVPSGDTDMKAAVHNLVHTYLPGTATLDDAESAVDEILLIFECYAEDEDDEEDEEAINKAFEDALGRL